DDAESLTAQLSCHRSQYQTTQSCGRSWNCRVRSSDPESMLLISLALHVCIARVKKLVKITRGGFDIGSFGQFVAVNRGGGHRPQIAALVTKRILKQHRARVEHLGLNLFEREGLRLR